MSAASWVLAERPPMQRLASRPDYRWLVIGTVCVGAFLGQLDASIAGLVLPTLEEVFHAPVANVEWVAISYLLTLAALVVPFGRLADMVGRKALYSYGFVVFVAGSALCGFASSLEWLIVFRVIQAVGAAMLQANSVAIIAAAARPRELGKAIGIQGAAQAVGLSVGPSVGGLLIATAGWQWVFLIAVPFGLAGALLGYVVLPQTQPSTAWLKAESVVRRERFDWLGASIFAPAIVAALVALTYANTWGWHSPQLLITAGAAVTLVALFLVVEARSAHPLVDLALFRDRLFSAGISAGLLSYAVLFGSLFLVPFYLERVLGRAPNQAGLLLSPVPLALGILAPLAGVATDRFGSRLPTVAGMALACLALLGLAALPSAPGAAVLVVLAVLGTGLGLFTPPNNSAVMSSAPPHRLGVAGGILNMTRSLGTSLGVAATGAVLAVRLGAHAGQHVVRTVDAPAAALLPAFRETLLFLAALAAAAGLISALRGRTANATDLDAAPATTAAERAERQLVAAEAAGA